MDDFQKREGAKFLKRKFGKQHPDWTIQDWIDKTTDEELAAAYDAACEYR